MSSETQKNSHPADAIIELLDCEWSPALLRLLQEGEKQYSQIEFALHTIQPSTLASGLRLLIKHGAINRNVNHQLNTITTYSLTEKGYALSELLLAFTNYKKYI